MNTKVNAGAKVVQTASNPKIAGNSKSNSKSVKDRVLAALKQGRRLTHMDVWTEFGSSRASHYIYELRQEGWPIITDLEEVPTSDGARRAKIAFYSISTELLKIWA